MDSRWVAFPGPGLGFVQAFERFESIASIGGIENHDGGNIGLGFDLAG